MGVIDNEIVFGEGNVNEFVIKDDNINIFFWRDGVKMNVGKVIFFFFY